MQPILIVSGPPGAGKSTLARAVAERFPKALCIPLDDLREWVVSGLAAPVPEWTEETGRQFELAENAAADVALRYAAAGFAVVIDHCRLPENIDAWVERCFSNSVAGRFPKTVLPFRIAVFPPLDVVLERNRSRKNKLFDPIVLEPTIRGVHGAYLAAGLDGWTKVENLGSVDASVHEIWRSVLPCEAVLLNGGASKRMGSDKALLEIEGESLGRRVARSIQNLNIPVTVLGRSPVHGFAFQPDRDDFAGPLTALAAFRPAAKFVFVSACDIPLFDARIIPFLLDRIGEKDAMVPLVNGFRQPLCGLYARSAFEKLQGERLQPNACAMDWLNALDHATVSESELSAAGIDPQSAQGANTPEELGALLGQAADR